MNYNKLDDEILTLESELIDLETADIYGGLSPWEEERRHSIMERLAKLKEIRRKKWLKK